MGQQENLSYNNNNNNNNNSNSNNNIMMEKALHSHLVFLLVKNDDSLEFLVLYDNDD
jgi:hypothetical protein